MSVSKSTDTQREKALSRWDSEGGAGLWGPQQSEAPSGLPSEIPELKNAELVQLRIRVIALENLMIVLLSQASDGQLERARARWQNSFCRGAALRSTL